MKTIIFVFAALCLTISAQEILGTYTPSTSAQEILATYTGINATNATNATNYNYTCCIPSSLIIANSSTNASQIEASYQFADDATSNPWCQSANITAGNITVVIEPLADVQEQVVGGEILNITVYSNKLSNDSVVWLAYVVVENTQKTILWGQLMEPSVNGVMGASCQFVMDPVV